MSTRFRHVAPAGAPIALTDLARWMGSAARGHASDRLAREVRDTFGVDHAFLVSTGRAGMTLLLRVMHRLATGGSAAPGGHARETRDEVVLPTYTCYSVAASAVKAGLKVRLVDIDPATLDYDLDALRRTDLSRALAIVVTNLYGIPGNLPAIAQLAAERGVFLIDDAAQAMGARVGDRWSGTWGDAGLFSFDKGKNVSAIDGGVLVTSGPGLADALRHEVASLHRPGAGESLAGVVKAIGYATLLRPSVYWIPNRIPQLGLGRTVFTTEYPIEQPIGALTALAAAMMRRLETFTAARQAHASTMLADLATMTGMRTIRPVAGSRAVYLRLPVLAADGGTRDALLAALNVAGIGASGSYPASLADVAELRPHVANPDDTADGGREVARCLVTLPTHGLMNTDDCRRTTATIAAVTSRAATTTAARAATRPSTKNPVCAE